MKKSVNLPTFFYIFEIMLLAKIKKIKQKNKLKDRIYKEYEKALENKDFLRTGILSKRFLKIK